MVVHPTVSQPTRNESVRPQPPPPYVTLYPIDSSRSSTLPSEEENKPACCHCSFDCCQPTQANGLYGIWKYGLFDCLDTEYDACLFIFFCGHLSSCVVVEAVYGKGHNCRSCYNCIFFPFCLCCSRQEARRRNGIDGSALSDCFLSIFCSCCTMIQILREFDYD